MLRGLGWLVLRVVDWLELTVFTAFMYGTSYLPEPWRRWYPRLFHAWCRAFVRAMGVDLRLHQKNARPLPRQYILISNHPSAFEDIGVPALFPVVSLAKIEVADWWIVGRISRAAGTLYLKRELRESRRAAFQRILDELAWGKNICVYPEGGCKGRRVQPFRRGIFDVSLRSGVPILPVFLHYEAQEDFEWLSPQTLPSKILQILATRNSRANYYVHDAIHPGDFPGKEQYCDHVHGLYLAWQAKYLE